MIGQLKKLKRLKKKKFIKKLREAEIKKSWYFLVMVLLVYVFLFFADYDSFVDCVNSFLSVFIKILPIFILVFILMVLTNYFITPNFILGHIEKKKTRKWVFAVIGGILSTGPIYMWYPLLSDLREKGISEGLIACFLYNRAIKLPLIPVMVIYFSWSYILILIFIMIFISIVQGILINKFNWR